LKDTKDLSFIEFGYWDSLKKGLMSGERLSFDLKRMEVAYLNQNKREYEITKNVSLMQLNPLALLELKQTGQCEMTIPEGLFDMDYPGHYMRRIKSVSITIPCITGPYTSVNCTLNLQKSILRHTSKLSGGMYQVQEDDPRFTYYFNSIQSIVTSSGQNDSGMFETNLRDERYLPFEGSGVISTWRLELPKDIRQFDYNTISDVILHMRYTARDGGDQLKKGASNNLKTMIDEAKASGSVRLFSVRHEFPMEWAKFIRADNAEAIMELEIREEHFPFWSKGWLGTVKRVDIFASDDQNSKGFSSPTHTGTGKLITYEPDGTKKPAMPLQALTDISLPKSPERFILKIRLDFDNNLMEELWLAKTWGK
jgi:Tc toxin complex TcA C-terminal TcB-binding domain